MQHHTYMNMLIIPILIISLILLDSERSDELQFEEVLLGLHRLLIFFTRFFFQKPVLEQENNLKSIN